MAIDLVKGERIDLTKGRPSLNTVLIGLGWDVNKYEESNDFDLDATAFLLDKNENSKDENIVFYGQLVHQSDSVKHYGDNRTGNGEGDDEIVEVNLNSVPSEIESIDFVVTIYKANERGQNFGMVSNAYIRLVDKETNEELIRYELNEDFSSKTAVVFAKLYRHKGEWKFNAIGNGYHCDLADLCQKYGIDVKGG